MKSSGTNINVLKCLIKIAKLNLINCECDCSKNNSIRSIVLIKLHFLKNLAVDFFLTLEFQSIEYMLDQVKSFQSELATQFEILTQRWLFFFY